jgi:hypothetical protein
MAQYQPVNRVAEYASGGKEILGEYPMSSVMIAFGLGVATGLALTVLFTDEQESHYQRHTAHRLGQQLLDAMTNMLPETVSKSFRS